MNNKMAHYHELMEYGGPSAVAAFVQELITECDDLREWKRQALQEFVRWHTLGEELQNTYPLRIGQHVPVALLKAIIANARGRRGKQLPR